MGTAWYQLGASKPFIAFLDDSDLDRGKKKKKRESVRMREKREGFNPNSLKVYWTARICRASTT